jgi:carboxymethylenebutenolidase
MNRQDAKNAKEKTRETREKKVLGFVVSGHFPFFSLSFLGVLGVLAVSCSPAPPKPEAAPTETPPPVQETVSYLDSDKNVHGYLCRPSGVGPYPAVLMIHDHMGLTDAIKDAAFRLARQDYVVLAVDLYRGRVAKNREEAERLESELPRERVLTDLKAAVDYLCQRADVQPEQLVGEKKRIHVLGGVGLGMGGSYALEAALRDPRLRALALCYCRLPTDAKQLATLEASVFAIFAGKDKIVPSEMITQFTRAMNEAGKQLYGVRDYDECPHGFLDPADWPIYGKPPESAGVDPVAEAWDLIAHFLDSYDVIRRQHDPNRDR